MSSGQSETLRLFSRRSLVTTLIFAVIAAPGVSVGAEAPIALPKTDPVLEAFEKLDGSIERFTLANGLRVVLDPDASSSTAGISVTYDVGSTAEGAGQSGFAHLFEHMMFQGSKNAPKGQHFRLIAARGGSLNGSTDADYTNFYEELPANELALGLWLEADRMRSLQVTETNFQNQRAVVEEEFRMRVQNQPYAPAELRLGELAFAHYTPYAHPVIGSLADLDAARFDWVREFYARYYGPNNAVLTVAGHFTSATAKALIEQYFGNITQRSAAANRPLPTMPASSKPSREVVVDRNAPSPAILLGFVIPPSRTREHYALDLLCDVLAGGESSRLYTHLVHQQGIAQEVSAWTEGHVGPDQLTVRVVLSEKGDIPAVERAVDEALARLEHDGPSLEELARAQQKHRTAAALGLQSNLNRAIQLGQFEAEYGDARLLASEVKHYLALVPEDVRSAASGYLSPSQATRIEVQPTERTQP